jgi:hypothetical protein
LAPSRAADARILSYFETQAARSGGLFVSRDSSVPSLRPFVSNFLF